MSGAADVGHHVPDDNPPIFLNQVLVKMTLFQIPFIIMVYAYCVIKTNNPMYLLTITIVAWISCVVIQRLLTTVVRKEFDKRNQLRFEIMKGLWICGLIGKESQAYLFFPFSFFVGTYAFSILNSSFVFLSTTLIVKIIMALAAMFYIGNSLDEIFGALVILVLFGAMSLLCCSFTTLIIEMEQKQHETTRLHHTMQLYEKLYQHAPVMFFSLEESTNNIVQMNKLAEQVTNSQSLGVSFLSLFQEKDIEQVNQTLQALNDEKSVVHSNNHFKLQCGVDVSLCVTRMRDTRTGQILLHVILNDVSAVAELNGKLVRAKEKAERSSLAKSQFLAMISHEIRTPLHATICSCDLLQDTELTVEQRNFADIMSTSSHLLLKILDFSKIEAGALTLDKKLFNLWDCAESIVASMKYKAQEKLVSLTLTISPNVPKQIIGDSTRFSQVLVNLTSNAIKFTEVHGSVDISIYVEEENPHMLLVSVKDTGIGIPASGIDLLFKHFSQIDNSSSRRFDGTGLGLAISKRIAEIMGGTITVHSTEGEGSTFTFSCIIDTQDDEQEVCLLPPVEKQFLPSNYKILVAEDNPINQHIMQRMLTRIGFTDIVIANNGEEAFEAYERQPYDWKLILMDNFMPKQDGLTCTRLIRELEKELGKDPVTIIAVTASATRTQQQECYAAGMNEFITKPVVMSTLKELLAKACTKC